MIRQDYFAGCQGKQGFASKADALHHIRLIVKRRKKASLRNKRDGKIEAYPCRHCDKWHLGRPST